MLSVIPKRRYGIPVVVAHNQTGGGGEGKTGGRRPRCAGGFGEKVHQSAVIGHLLGEVVVILIGGSRLRPVEPERRGRAGAVGGIGCVCVVVEQRRAEAVDTWRVRISVKRRIAFRIQGNRIGTEVMIERNVFLKDHHQMFNRRDGAGHGRGSLSVCRSHTQYDRSNQSAAEKGGRTYSHVFSSLVFLQRPLRRCR